VPDDLKNWKPRPRPERKVLEGRYVRLEPLDAQKHGDGLYEASTVPDAAERFAWLPDYPPESRAAFQPWLEQAQASPDPLFFAVIDKASGKVAGRQTLMRIDAANGVVEIGHIYWWPLISRSPAAPAAWFLFLTVASRGLGSRRCVGKASSRNDAADCSALRFGFSLEGLFRQQSVDKGNTRDASWCSVSGKEWPALKKAYEGWLDPSNFDKDGVQVRRLEDFRK